MIASLFFLLAVGVLGNPSLKAEQFFGDPSLIGDDVRFQCTNCFPPTDDTFTVIEGQAELILFFNELEVDVEADTLTLTWLFDSTMILPDIEYVLSDLDFSGSPNRLVNATIDDASTWGGNGSLSFTSDSVTYNNNGDQTISVGDFLRIELHASAIPEPGASVIFSIGLIAFVLKRNRCY